MAEYERGLDDEVRDSSMLEVVDVASANSDRLDLNQDFTGAG
jgi:hypothetical protein